MTASGHPLRDPGHRAAAQGWANHADAVELLLAPGGDGAAVHAAP